MAILLLTRSAVADDHARVRLVYSAPEGCPSEESFLRDARSRTAHVQPIDDASAEKTLRVSVERAGGQGHASFTGRLVVQRSNGGGDTAREVPGGSCEEVVSALALISALTLDPSARTRRSNGELEGRSASNESPASPAAIVVEPQPIAPHSVDRSVDVATVRAHDRWTLGAGAHTAVHGGLAPDPTISLSAFIQLRSPGGSGLWRPTFRAGAARGWSDANGVRGSSGASFGWTVGTIEVCPARWSPLASIDVSPCLRAEAGVLEGEGRDIEPARSEKRTWLGADLSGRLTVRVAGPLFAELEGGARSPLLRTRYYFQPDTTVFRPPMVAAFAGAGIGVSLP
jgi:hypothetical protein